MKTTIWIITMMVTAAVVGYGQQSKLTPPGPPGDTMFTLKEIYDLVDGLQQQVAAMQQELAAMRLCRGASGMAETVGGMVLIPAGTFRMGDTFTEGGAEERPVHTVSVSAFYMGQYEVTKALWDEVRTYATGQGYTDLPAAGGKGPSHPVHSVNWYDCVKWANARSQRDGLTPVYYTTANFSVIYKSGTDMPYANWSANGYRLPTEAEWEKAARGGVEERRFPWADGNTISHTRTNYSATPSIYDYDVNSTSGYHPDYSGGSTPHTSPVGSFAPNGYGLYDMAGNLREWCWDLYFDTYYASSPGKDPRGPVSGTRRVRRGGDWSYHGSSCRVAIRHSSSPGDMDASFGFRLVRNGP